MWLHVTSCDYHVSWSLVHRKTHVNVKFVVPGLLWSSRMWGGFHQADRSVWCCHVGSPDDRKATAAVRSFCWLFFPVAFAEYISECNKSRHLEHSITLILVDIRVYLSCRWWLLVWSHVWRWRHIGPNMPQLWTGSLCEELSSSVSSFLCDSVAVWARGLVVNLCFAKVCVIARNSTTHLLTFSQSLKDFIGIDSFYRDLDPAFRHLPPSSTTERWGNNGANGDSSCCDLGTMALSELWPLTVSRGHYLQFMAMSTEKTNGEKGGSDPWRPWGALSGKPSSVNLHDLRVSAAVILYVLCMHVHALHCITYHETFKRM